MSQNVFADSAIISGKVTYNGSGLPATVSLIQATDSVWLKSVLTDDSGNYAINEVGNGNYIISAQSYGYNTVSKNVSITDSVSSTCFIVLEKLSNSLTEVTVSAKKPFLEMAQGKIVVNIDGLASNATGNALELLRRLPGVTVTGTSDIAIKGKQGIMVLIDDRQTYLTGDQLSDYLRNIAASEVAQIELITQPGAKYDAAGNMGIINIKTKKLRKQGFNGSALINPGQGVYTSFYGSLMLNYRKDKLSLSLTGSDREARGFADWTQEQTLKDPVTSADISKTKIHSTPAERFGTATVKAAADYSWSDQLTTGMSIKGNYHPNTMTTHVFTTREDVAGNGLSYNDVQSPNGFIRKDMAVNAYMAGKTAKGSTIDINADYLTFHDNSRQSVNNTSFNELMQPQPDPLLLESVQPTVISITSLKADYSYTFKNKIKAETGVKTSFVQTDNDVAFTIFKQNNWVNDTSRSNHFLYKENINAVYLNASKSLNEKWEAQLGLRAEHTYAEGLQQVHNSSFTRNYVSLFPTGYISYKMNDVHQFEVNAGRRIDRPAYKLLNPFIYYSFQYSYLKGNPDLLPEFTTNIELKHSYRNMLFTTLSLSNTRNAISDLLIVDNSSNSLYSTYKNIAGSKTIDCSVVFNKAIKQWLTLNVNADFYYASYKGVINNISMQREGTGFNSNMNAQFEIGKGWKANGTFYYNGKGIASIIEFNLPSVYLGLGVSKSIGKKIIVSVSADDPFYFYRPKSGYDIDNFHATTRYRFASQHFGLSFNYSFGTKPNTNHQATTVEEIKRVK